MTRHRHAAPSLLQRPNRGVVVGLVGLFTVALGGFAVYMSAARLSTGVYPLGTGPDGWLGGLTWEWVWGWAICAALFLLGVSLLVAAWKPGRRNAVTIDAGTIARDTASGREIIMANDEIEGWLRRSIESMDGVSKARVRASRRRITVRVNTSVSDPAVLRETIQSRIRDRVDGLRLKPNPSLRIHLT